MPETKFEWTDELVKEFMTYIFSPISTAQKLADKFINEFKKSKEVKPDYEIFNYRLWHNKDKEIFSVRRLSDNEVFSVGDNVYETITKGGEWIIKEFSLKDTRCFSCGVNINYIQKVNPPGRGIKENY